MKDDGILLLSLLQTPSQSNLLLAPPFPSPIKAAQIARCVFSTCLSPQINDINQVSISAAMWGDRGVHAESHMTEALIRENETHLCGPERARKCHSKLAGSPVCCYFISPTALGNRKRKVATSLLSKWEVQRGDSPNFTFLSPPLSRSLSLSLSLFLSISFSLCVAKTGGLEKWGWH